jgi:hypothetical protein
LSNRPRFFYQVAELCNKICLVRCVVFRQGLLDRLLRFSLTSFSRSFFQVLGQVFGPFECKRFLRDPNAAIEAANFCNWTNPYFPGHREAAWQAVFATALMGIFHFFVDIGHQNTQRHDILSPRPSYRPMPQNQDNKIKIIPRRVAFENQQPFSVEYSVEYYVS